MASRVLRSVCAIFATTAMNRVVVSGAAES
ncbi:capsid protein, partial [Salmonella enterica]|nr:capsid protein [Salmonella enterica]EBX0832784.1 capsid protein [Salmonella enterica subsp. enterica serovar Kottbus]ECI0960812.1 capsid protein [Salmonella enterica subsp. enterica serovar Muenchen]ECX3463992.1 capsid protein [Salmonella enterica subsp. enterica serovar Litchfield]EDN4631861.1 capsid protein [Salmonella enterica subsp. enterica serovar Virginia]EEJ9624678.1 capsid protein [Salmonella enterica subsp. enterica serovar Rubislaw]